MRVFQTDTSESGRRTDYIFIHKWELCADTDICQRNLPVRLQTPKQCGVFVNGVNRVTYQVRHSTSDTKLIKRKSKRQSFFYSKVLFWKCWTLPCFVFGPHLFWLEQEHGQLNSKASKKLLEMWKTKFCSGVVWGFYKTRWNQNFSGLDGES